MTTTNRVVTMLASFALVVVMIACDAVEVDDRDFEPPLPQWDVRFVEDTEGFVRELLEEYHSQAAKAEKAGRPVPPNVIDNIKKLERIDSVFFGNRPGPLTGASGAACDEGPPDFASYSSGIQHGTLKPGESWFVGSGSQLTVHDAYQTIYTRVSTYGVSDQSPNRDWCTDRLSTSVGGEINNETGGCFSITVWTNHGASNRQGSFNEDSDDHDCVWVDRVRNNGNNGNNGSGGGGDGGAIDDSDCEKTATDGTCCTEYYRENDYYICIIDGGHSPVLPPGGVLVEPPPNAG